MRATRNPDRDGERGVERERGVQREQLMEPDEWGKIRHTLVRIAAVAVAAIEVIDRGRDRDE